MASWASPSSQQGSSGLEVAIIGGGITGLALALGLEARGIRYKVYERAPGFQEIGAGVGFSPNAERAMAELNADLLTAFRRVANPNGEDYFQWVDGYNSPGELIFKLHLGEGMFQGCRRSDYIDELAGIVPREKVVFEKAVEMITRGEDGRQVVRFADGSSATADIGVIGCDGIHSKVRRLLLGENNPASYPSYTHKYCFRALIPVHKAVEAIGPEHGAYRTSTRFMYNGPGAHLLTYPVAMGTMLNVLVVLSDPDEWKHPKHTARTTKRVAVEFFKSWPHPTVKALIDLLPEELDMWAIFDMFDHSAEKYNEGCVAIAGDAAHAAGPHLGAGAGFGIEDALCLSTVLWWAECKAKVMGKSATDDKRVEICSEALETYDRVRRERTYSLLGDTREACFLFQLPRTLDVSALHQWFTYNVTWFDKELSVCYGFNEEACMPSPSGPPVPGASGGISGAVGWRHDDMARAKWCNNLVDNAAFGTTISELFHKIWHYDVERELVWRPLTYLTAHMGQGDEGWAEWINRPTL